MSPPTSTSSAVHTHNLKTETAHRTPLASSARPAAALRPGPSLHTNIVWSVLGNSVYSACQWGMLVGVARMSDVVTVGTLGLALALTSPIFLLAGLQLRPVLATDIRDAHPFSHYFLVRSATSLIAAVAASIASPLVTANPQARATIVALAVAKMLESMDDILSGAFQKYERLDIAGRLRIVKGVGSLLALLAVLHLTKSLPIACLGMGSFWAITTFGLNLRCLRYLPVKLSVLSPRPTTHSAFELVRSAAPLGLAMCLISLQANLPRLVLERYRGLKDVGIYTAGSSLLIAGSALLTAVGVAVTPRLARLSTPAQRGRFWSLVRTFLLLAGSAGTAAVVLTLMLGKQIMVLLFGATFEGGGRALCILSIAMTFTFVASVSDFSLIARRHFSSQLGIHFASTLVCCVAAFALIPRYGLPGAAWSVVMAALTRLAISLSILNNQRTKQPSKCTSDLTART